VLNYRFRLYPTKEQEFALEQTLDGGRWVYNSLDHLHNGLQLLRIPAQRRKSTPVETAMQSEKQEVTVRAW
jgi:transposase